MAAAREGAIPDLRKEDMFFIGNYVRDLPANQSRYVTEFYKTAEKAARAAADLNNAQNQGNEAKAERLSEKNEALLELKPTYDSIKKQLTDINNQIKAIERDTEMSGAEKRKEIDELYRERNSLTKEIEVERVRMKREAQ
jgi:predicted  nucleic acid-binding Zn-ribbon protein